jgi:hypothetical protein
MPRLSLNREKVIYALATPDHHTAESGRVISKRPGSRTLQPGTHRLVEVHLKTKCVPLRSLLHALNVSQIVVALFSRLNVVAHRF